MSDLNCPYCDVESQWLWGHAWIYEMGGRVMPEAPELFNEYVRKARKQHICCECGKTVIKGEKYCYISGKWNGDFDSSKQCLPCNDAKLAYNNTRGKKHGKRF